MGNVFFKLLNMSIAAGWLVLAVAALRLVFKKAPRWVFCVLWAMVALRLALPFSVQSPFSVVPSVNTVSVVTEPVSSDPVSVPDEYSAPQTAIPAEVSSPQGYVSPSEHSAPEEPVSRPAYTETDPSPVIPGTVDPAQTDNAHQQIQRIVIKTGIPAIDNTISAAETERAYTGEEQTGDIGAVLFWIWASGAALMASYAAFSYLRLRLRLRCSIKGADGAYVCDTIDTPFILGLFRPRIYVPSGMNGRERSYVLAHEKAHLRRFDHLWKPLGYLMLAAYWFNPLMWLAYIFFCRDIEIACDEKVVKTLDTESKAGYSQTLLDLNRPRRMISACPLAFGEVGVKERIKKVLSYKKPTLWILIAALLLTTVLAVCLMTDPKEKSAEALPKELQMLKSGDYYMELCYEDVVSESDMKAVLVFARKDGVASRSGINRMKNYEAQSNYTLLCSDGKITFINTYKHTYYAPIYPVCVTDHGYEMFALVAENEYKLSEHLQPEGGAEAYVFEKDGEKLTFEYENGELKRVKFPKSVGFDEDTAFEVLLFTDKVPEDMMFSVPEGYRDLGADTPEDEKCDSIEFCNHYGEYDVERFDIDALLKEFENKGYLLISPSELDYIEAPLEHAYAVLAGSGPAVWVYAYESAEKAAEDYRTEKLEDLTPRSVFEMLRWPAEHSRIRVNEYIFTVYDDILAGIDHHTLAAEIMNALGIEIPVYTAPAHCLVKHLDKDISADFAELLAGRGYEVYAAQGDGELCDKFWVAVAPDGSAASIAHSSPAEYAGALIYAANELWYCLEDSVYISGYGAPVTVTALNSGYTVFANPAKSNELIKIITGENSTEEQFVPGGDIEIPDFLSKPFKELSAHPVPGTLNIYTCDELGGARAIFQTDGTSKARIDECFVFDHEYTDPASDYTMRVYAGRRFMNNGDGTYRAKTAYAVVGDLSDSPQYFEEEPVVYGKLVIVDHTDANGSVAGRRVFAPGLDNDPEIKYFDQVYTREGSDYILVNYSYYYESAERRPNWFVFDKNGTAYSLPVPAQYRWNVNSISFDTLSDDPDDVIAKYVLYDDTVTTVKANLKDMRPFTDLSAYYCKAPESSKHVLVLDPVEGSDLFYTCDEYPGKNIINGINSQTSFVFVVDEELFSLTGPDGTKATVFSGTDVHYGSGDLIEAESYAVVCGDTKTVVRADTAPRKLGDNLFYYTNKDDGFIPSGVLYFIMDSHLMHFSCFSEPGVREGVDGVFFTNEYPDTAELGEWVVIGKDGVLRSLPELDGKRYLIKDITFDPAYAEGGRVRVTAYRWNMELLGYEEFSFGADLASCRAVGLEYYGLGINDLYGNYTFKNVYPEVSASSLPTKAGFFELDAFPGYMLLRTKENRVIKLIKQFDDTAKWERDGKEYEARGYDADIYGISNGKLVYLELGSAVICGENAKPWGYGRTVKYHNLFISSEFDEADGRLCYSYDPSGSGKILSVEYLDLTYGRKNEFCMVRIDEKDEYGDLIIDWQGCTYSLEGDGKPFAADEIKYDEEKGMIAYTESSQQSYFGEFKYIAFEDLHRDDATNYDLISVDPSGEKPSFPGKKIICAGVDGEYPFYVVDKELFTLDWDGKKASGFEGRFVEYAGGKVKTSWCFGVACGDKVCRFNHKGASLYAKGKLAIYEDKERATGYVLTGFGETFEKYRFETISVRDGADCVILNDVTWSERNLYPASMIIGLDGSVRSLPVADEIRWRLIRIEFNYASDDPNAVVVHWYKYFTLHASANEFPSYRIGSPFAASVKDTSPVEFAEYYASDPAEHWNY